MRLLRPILYLTTILVAAVVSWRGWPPFDNIAAGVLAGVILVAIDLSCQNNELLRFLLNSIYYFGRPVRLSISYLYRIKVDNRYLLIKGHRIPDQYQPVGGVIKLLPDGAAYLWDFDAKGDDLFPIDKASVHDLRISIDGKHLFKFMQWYESGKGRETDCWREFYEELVRPEIVPRDAFGFVFTRHIRRHVTPVQFSNHVQKHECLIAEIYELIATAEQEAELKKLQKADSAKYTWATEDEIRRQGVIQGRKRNMRIPITASWIL